MLIVVDVTFVADLLNVHLIFKTQKLHIVSFMKEIWLPQLSFEY
jgi:hypothetical protein